MCYILANMAYHTGDLISLQFFFNIHTMGCCIQLFYLHNSYNHNYYRKTIRNPLLYNIPTFTFACRHNEPHSVFSENESKTTLYVMTLAEGIECSLNDLFLFYKLLIIVDN